MEAEEFVELYDSLWFQMELFNKKQDSSTSLSKPEPNPPEIQEIPQRPELCRIPTKILRSMSDHLDTKAIFNSGFSLSPDSVVTPKLKTILSGKESTEEEEEEQNPVPVIHRKKVIRKRRGKRGSSKSLSELEYDELKGFMDLGFVFTEEDKESSLASIIPGLQRLGKKEEAEKSPPPVDESAVCRPYLSEAWDQEELERKEEANPLMNWRIPIPALSNEVDMKDSLRWWAHTVASTVV
ncbi:hypothetical protein Tsubulata_017593 [Turnera subulata]|uniref:DUF1685 domain-containing protein n=1 Tax=Turnera subulata TaxID=218843 RepID=A0A9Q0JJD5_9ROSI|nr:hypothetical protein Tsubulata_017593 [Turnera subulata]